MLNCGKHACPQRCHQLLDHSKVQCKQIIQGKCPQNHDMSWECWRQSAPCGKCEAEARKREAQRRRDHMLDLHRQTQERAYAQRLAELDDEIAHEGRLRREHSDNIQRERVLQQRMKDLADARAAKWETPAAKSPGLEPDAGTESKTPKTETLEVENPVSPSAESDRSEDKHEGQNMEQSNESQAKLDWEYQKQFENADNEHLDALMEMIGLESVKQQFLTIKTKIDTCIRQRVSIKDERFGAALLGNPGTGMRYWSIGDTGLIFQGKTTLARIYAKFLASVGVLPGTTVKETTGARLASEGVQACKKLIEEVLNNGGGAIFIDEAYQLTSKSNYGGGQVLDFLLAEVENLTGKIVFILAGYNKQMEGFFAHNPGIPSRFPHELQFKDYEDEELRRIFDYQIKKRFRGRMKAEEGLHGLYCRIVARRVGYGRGREGFGNARAVENVFARVLSRQATRLAQERRAGRPADDMLLTQEDLIGPQPSNALQSNSSWKKLKSLTGLKAVKQSVWALFDSIQYNYERELDEKPLLQFNLNRVFLGSPGTGKTTVAKLYGQVLADIGLLSNGEGKSYCPFWGARRI